MLPSSSFNLPVNKPHALFSRHSGADGRMIAFNGSTMGESHGRKMLYWMDATAVQVEQYTVRTEVSSPSSSCTLSHTRHTVLSGVCDTLCFLP